MAINTNDISSNIVQNKKDIEMLHNTIGELIKLIDGLEKRVDSLFVLIGKCE